MKAAALFINKLYNGQVQATCFLIDTFKNIFSMLFQRIARIVSVCNKQ